MSKAFAPALSWSGQLPGATDCLSRARAQYLLFRGGCSKQGITVSSLRLPWFYAIVEPMFGRVMTTITLMAAIVLLLVLQITDPSTIGPGGILAVFFLLYIVSVGCVTWLIKLSNWIWVYLLGPAIRKRPRSEMTFRRAYYFGSVVAMGPIMFLGMSSVGSAGLYEAALVFVFEAIAIFYIEKRF